MTDFLSTENRAKFFYSDFQSFDIRDMNTQKKFAEDFLLENLKTEMHRLIFVDEKNFVERFDFIYRFMNLSISRIK